MMKKNRWVALGEHRIAVSKAIGSVVVALSLAGCGVTAAGTSHTPSLRSEALQLTRDLSQGNTKAVETHFDSAMRSALPSSSLFTLWSQLVTENGIFVRIGSVHMEKVQDTNVAVVTVVFHHQSIGLQWTFAPAGQVAGLHLVPPSTSPT